MDNLPGQDGDEPPRGRDTERMSLPSAGAADTGAGVVGPVVLLAEDDDDIREVLMELLGSAGYVVQAAGDGIAALEQMRGGHTPDVVLADVMMPRMDGPELVRQMRADPALGSIPVVLMTAAPRVVPPDIAHVVPVATKPLRLQALLELLERVRATT